MYFCGKSEVTRNELLAIKKSISRNQVYAWKPDFEKNNLTRWTKQNLLVKLRNSWYSFPEYLKIPNIF